MPYVAFQGAPSPSQRRGSPDQHTATEADQLAADTWLCVASGEDILDVVRPAVDVANEEYLRQKRRWQSLMGLIGQLVAEIQRRHALARDAAMRARAPRTQWGPRPGPALKPDVKMPPPYGYKREKISQEKGWFGGLCSCTNPMHLEGEDVEFWVPQDPLPQWDRLSAAIRYAHGEDRARYWEPERTGIYSTCVYPAPPQHCRGSSIDAVIEERGPMGFMESVYVSNAVAAYLAHIQGPDTEEGASEGGE
ncbi:unnamed protein product [Vitrella brassicaformis CCMP3155]|uniref:Uncharacterized protein n=1 Tax=Vitrella brassicaformis (strain CCMP3155) TaxID=1169540 RepID=A0A0G4F700_VITBC|nr:unnamed protein product [Vitrella brassicaformis CCMP3155]|mmetsp:Transcript_41396/g.103333  ORF Transcript_41396/g.103333 Transcript_41396/m.103333 type:complete len:250 (-) Transcript_41396:286-1035(-)|eukprot:CEM08017.1 unnamed protein product [Vitrella brassicaformis CCMP3155]